MIDTTKVKIIIKHRKIKIKTLADLMKITPQTLYNYLHNKRPMPYNLYLELCKQLKICPYALTKDNSCIFNKPSCKVNNPPH